MPVVQLNVTGNKMAEFLGRNAFGTHIQLFLPFNELWRYEAMD